MKPTEPSETKTLRQRTAVRIAVMYAIFAGLWIFFSDTVLGWLLSDPAQLTHAQTAKGVLFVAVTALLLYLYLCHCLKALHSREDAIEKERIRSQRELEDRFKQLSTLFDAMNAIVYVADMESYELLYVNRFATESFGQDWQGRKCYQYLQEGFEQPCDICTNPQLVSNGEPAETVIWEFLNTQNNHWYECFDKAIRWTDGRLVRLEVALDVTERRELEKLKDELLSSVSHEMRTPLTAIDGFAELLLDEPEIPEQHRRHIKIIYKEAEKLTELINRFLDIRRLKINRTRTDYKHIPIPELLEKAKDACRERKSHHDIRIECPSDAQLYGNHQELVQVFTQLLQNACRYSPDGGRISLRVQLSDREIAIHVTDHGIGIPKHELESIFSLFHRLDTGDRRRTGGVGLGLCVAREIVRLHGGEIKVTSTPGQGSTFSVVLPQPPERDDNLSGHAVAGNE